MRAVTKTLASFCNKTGNSSHSFDAINFLAMAGIFDENDDTLATIHPYVKKQTKGSGSGSELSNGNKDKVQIAIERLVDRAIEFILAYPDLEYTENTIDMTALREKCQIDFVEGAIAAHAVAVAAKKAQAVVANKAPTPSSIAEGQNSVSGYSLAEETVLVALQELASTPRIANTNVSATVANA